MDIDTISREELKEKLERGDDFKLVMALGEWHFRAKRIPGSVNITTPEEGLEVLKPDEEIVVYCSNEACAGSIFAYKFLKEKGYENVRRYSGGLLDWEDAGYPMEGEMVAEG